MTKLLFTASEAAEMLGIGRTKTYELLASGALRSVRIGTCRRVPMEAIEAFLHELQLQGAAEDCA